MVVTVIKFIPHEGSIFTEHVNKPEQWTEAWVVYQFINHAVGASVVTHIAGEIYQVMQKMQGLHTNGWVGWVGWGGEEAEAQMWGDEEDVMSIWAKEEQLMKRLALTKPNHRLLKIIQWFKSQ